MKKFLFLFALFFVVSTMSAMVFTDFSQSEKQKIEIVQPSVEATQVATMNLLEALVVDVGKIAVDQLEIKICHTEPVEVLLKFVFEPAIVRKDLHTNNILYEVDTNCNKYIITKITNPNFYKNIRVIERYKFNSFMS